MTDQKLTSVLDNGEAKEIIDVDKSRVDILRLANGSAFAIAMIVNATSNFFSKATQPEIVAEWDVKLSPSGWAFSIWGVIYTLLAGFTVYQGFPNDKISGGKNEAIIYGKVGYLYVINMLANAVWLCLFGQDNALAFGLAAIDIVIMYVTGMKILQISVSEKLNNWWERIFFRGGFSLYVGWLTAASILNVCFLLKSLGIDEGNTNVDNEMFWSKAVLIVALILYNAYSFVGRNPLFGAVFIWVLLAIKDF